MNKQYGGWYLNPQTGKVQRWWDGVWTDGAEPQSSIASAGADSNTYYSQLEDSVNKYIDDLMSEAGNRRDLLLKRLDAEHKLALGNDDTARAEFLERVADGLEQKIGRIPYDYQRYSARELESYAMDTKQNEQNRSLALQKLENDEKALRQEQISTNKTAVEELNARGLLEGQRPIVEPDANIGPAPIQGLTGLAGATAGSVNQQFANRWGQSDLNRQGVNLSADQFNEQRGFQNRNLMEDLTVDARRGAQDQQNAFTFGREGANLDYEEQRKALERQRDELKRKAQMQAQTLGGKNQGLLGY